jgi:CRISPR/Cas system CMR-associated protein Cmr1 (group 7 of RAMP superfamily)
MNLVSDSVKKFLRFWFRPVNAVSRQHYKFEYKSGKKTFLWQICQTQATKLFSGFLVFVF